MKPILKLSEAEIRKIEEKILKCIELTQEMTIILDKLKKECKIGIEDNITIY